MSEKAELKARWEAKKSELKAEYERLKNESTVKAQERRTAIERKIEEVEASVKDGWENLGENVSGRINELLDSAGKKKGKS